MIDRDDLERQALMAVSASLHYELADQIDSMTDAELVAVIRKGAYAN